MSRRNLIITVGALVVFAGLVAYFTLRTDKSTSAAPEGTWWVCMNPSCGNTFNLSLAELAAHHKNHWGEQVPCPKCKKAQTIRGEKCTNCGKVFVLDRSSTCPSCKTLVVPKPTG
jgi:hypothetical protein